LPLANLGPTETICRNANAKSGKAMPATVFHQVNDVYLSRAMDLARSASRLDHL
jgi:hypothetical protein